VNDNRKKTKGKCKKKDNMKKEEVNNDKRMREMQKDE
jgi:hypothetical protein